jgi:integrase/recombinase XerD
MNQSTEKTNGLSRNIQIFLNDRKAQNLSNGTIEFYKKKLAEFYKFCTLNEISEVENITPDLLRRFFIELKEKKHSEGGIHCYFRACKTLLIWYESEYEPDHWKNPIRKIKPPKITIEPLEGVSKSDFDSLLKVCEKGTFFGERNKSLLLILLETGIRASELCSIQIEDISFFDNSILIRSGKGRKPRFVFIGKTVRKQIRCFLKIIKAEKGFLFTTKTGKKLSYFTLREIVRRLSKKAMIKEPGIHDFRRSFCLESLRNHVDLVSLSRLMGHKDLTLLTRYSNQNNQDLGTAYKSVVD